MTTLKISDLSVGDWVEWRERICTISSIYGSSKGFPDEVALLSKENTSLGVRFFNELHPIPITAEILEKIGWRIIEKEALGEDYEYDGTDRVWNNYDNKIDICEEKQGVFWHSYSGVYYLCRLYYVHQLQHLMRLYGVDKEITL